MSVEGPASDDTRQDQRVGEQQTSRHDHSGLPDSVRVAIPLGLGLIVATFTALGIQGEVMSRLMRNSPTSVIWAFAFGVLGVAIPFLALVATGRVRNFGFVIGAALLTAGTLIAVWAAVNGTGIREQPTVSIVPQPSEAGATDGAGAKLVSATPDSIQIGIKAAGLSLASNDRMLLQVVAFEPATSLTTARMICSSSVNTDVPPDSGGTVLFWGEAGPTTSGSGTVAITLSVDQAKSRYLCAHAVLSARPGTRGTGQSFTSTLVDVRHLEPAEPEA